MSLKQYLITDPKYYGTKVLDFEDKLDYILKSNQVDIACFRDKTSANYEELAKAFIRICKSNKIETILLNENYLLAKELGASGVHLTSQQFDSIKEVKDLDLFVIISCHNVSEVEKAQKRYVNAITYSPIFQTPNKDVPKGVAKLAEVCNIFDMHIFALGGIITNDQIKKIENTRASGFASIRYFCET
ncbi:MAG: thiamine phosphate synthase [Campylobacteraceae bacterium]|nr:thiamine phosphate synthase [Campylobacteraceae bacterium]